MIEVSANRTMNSDPRHRVEFHQLWIDKIRDGLDKGSSPEKFARNYERKLRTQVLATLARTSIQRVRSLTPQELAIEYQNHNLTGPITAIGLQAVKSRGYPERQLVPADDWLPCQFQINAVMTWCSVPYPAQPRYPDHAA